MVKEKRGSVAARVFVDTNVLFPFSVMDVMLALTEDSVHEIVWSERLLAEWERVIVREGRRSAESAAAVAQAVRRFFADWSALLCRPSDTAPRAANDVMWRARRRTAPELVWPTAKPQVRPVHDPPDGQTDQGAAR
ncbi:hypothetical protein ACH4CE_01575 [Streptomyces gelaticus]|uniref:hypothetical protein n=1 Tax=Streptomyces gelaticus TaxID=285446 RepID=UPI0037BD8A0E